MRIDPNQPVDYHQECVCCEGGKILLFDGTSTEISELGLTESAFGEFCRSLDPNKCFIVAFIPNDADREVFFRAREVARDVGIHMQATIDTAERHRALWENYKTMKQYSSEPTATSLEEGETQ